jgi:hypothetical protein
VKRLAVIGDGLGAVGGGFKAAKKNSPPRGKPFARQTFRDEVFAPWSALFQR